MSEKDVDKAGTVKPELCIMCHEAQGKQFTAGKHAMAWKAVQGLPSAHWQPMTSLEGSRGCDSCHKIGFKQEKEIRELQDQGAGFGVASCDICHAHHAFSLNEARQPKTCQVCHRGLDQPLWEVYSSSKHGIRNALKRDGTLPEDTPAPTCQECHMKGGDHGVRTAWGFLAVRLPVPEDKEWAAARKTILQALGMLDPKGRPTERHVLIKELDLARLTEEDWQKERDRMAKTCFECHPKVFVDRLFENGDRMVREADLLMAEAIRIVSALYEDNIVAKPRNTPYSFPDFFAVHDAPAPIEQKLYMMFLKHRMSAFQGAFHANPDYALYQGLVELRSGLAEIRAMDEQLRASAKKGR
jgi:hydroxylamine dehydrogenase